MDTLIDLGSRGSLERSYNLSTIINTPTTTYTPQDKNIKSYEFWLNLIRIWINQFLFLRWQEERWQYSQGQSMTGHLSLRFCMFVCYDFIILKSLICFFFLSFWFVVFLHLCLLTKALWNIWILGKRRNCLRMSGLLYFLGTGYLLGLLISSTEAQNGEKGSQIWRTSELHVLPPIKKRWNMLVRSLEVGLRNKLRVLAM